MGKLINKKCERCGEELINVHSSTKYCNKCKEVILKENQKRFYNKNPYQSKYSEDEYRNNLLNSSNNPENLTTVGFNMVSKIKVQGYRNYYNITWIDVLKKYNKFNDLYNYIISEYENFYIETGLQNIQSFCKKHKYITYRLLEAIGIDNIMKDANIRKLRYTDDDYKNNFLQIKERLSKIPLYNEFVENTLIPDVSYANKYNLKGKVYDEIVKMYSTEDEFNHYKTNQRFHKTEVGKITGKMCEKYSLEECEIYFKKIFDNYYKNTGEYPSSGIFDKISEHDNRFFRQKLNMTWQKVCKHYGYTVDIKSSKFESKLLSLFSKILYEKCEKQKTFKWLKNKRGFSLFCDGVFEEYKLVIEADGQQHKKPIDYFGGIESFKIRKSNDEQKDKLVGEYGYKMLRIDIDSNWHDINYLKERLEEIGIKVDENIKTAS